MSPGFQFGTARGEDWRVGGWLLGHLPFVLRRTVAAERERQNDPRDQRADVDGLVHECVRFEALGSCEILPER